MKKNVGKFVLENICGKIKGKILKPIWASIKICLLVICGDSGRDVGYGTLHNIS